MAANLNLCNSASASADFCLKSMASSSVILAFSANSSAVSSDRAWIFQEVSILYPYSYL